MRCLPVLRMARAPISQAMPISHPQPLFDVFGACRCAAQVNEMVAEALIGFEGKVFYDGLLKILITQ